MTVNGKHSSVVFRYEHGRIFQQADLAGTVVDEGQKPSGVKIVFRGRVTVRSQTTVKAYPGLFTTKHTKYTKVKQVERVTRRIQPWEIPQCVKTSLVDRVGSA